MIQIALPSVQSLLIEMRFGEQPLATGTGFVVESPKGPVLITNWHNVTGRNPETKQPLSKTGGVPDEIAIIHNQANSLGSWIVKRESLYQNEVPRWFEHPVLADRMDVVALPLTQLEDVALHPYNLIDIHRIKIGPADSISVIGFPFGLQAGGSLAVWATGFLASEPDIDFNNLPLMLIDCRTRQGQSGSAVIAYRSGGGVAMEDGGTAMFAGPVERFLGVYSGRINEQSDLGLVWKAKAVKEIVDSIR